MTVPAYYYLIFFLGGSVFPLLGVALGGWLVFKTKKESHESLFKLREPKGQVFNIEEDWEKELPEVSETPENVAKAAAKFRSQVATIKPKIADELEEKENV